MEAVVVPNNNFMAPMRQKHRVPDVLWTLFKKRAKTLAQTLLSFIPPATLQCRCNACPQCFSFLLREDDPSDYRYLLDHCFVVLSDAAPSLPPPLDHNSRYTQFEVHSSLNRTLLF